MAKTESRVLVLLALAANLGIAILKFSAAAISASASMLAEAFHSVADSGNQLFLLRGTAVSRYGADVHHPFGRGKELFFWSFMVAVVLFVGGAVVSLLQGWDRLIHPEEPHNFVLNLVVLALAGLFEVMIAFRPALREFNRRRGGRRVWPTLRDSKDSALLIVLLEDSAAVIGVLLAAVGITLSEVTGNSRWDGVGSIAIGLLLAATAWVLAYETKSLLVGEAASRQDRSAIRAAALAIPEVASVERLLTMQLGPDQILVNMEADLEDGLSGDDVEEVIDNIEEAVRSVLPEASEIFVELESSP